MKKIPLKICGITNKKSVEMAYKNKVKSLGFASKNLNGPNTVSDKKIQILIKECKNYKIESVLLTQYVSLDKLIKQIDFTKPKTIYHKSKLMAENEVVDELEHYIIIRTGWLFGGNNNSPKNFVRNRLLEAQNSKDIIKSNIDQHGNPTFTEDVVSNTYSLIKNDHIGLYNCVNKGFATRYEYVNEILKNDGRKNKIEPVRKSEFNRLANVSNNEMANNKNLNKVGLNKMPDWKISLKKYMSNIDDK